MVDLRQQQKTVDEVLRVSVERPEGSRVTLITPNWCDKQTWWYDSTKKEGQTLDHVSDYIVYESPTATKGWVDNYHGRYSNEDFLLTKDGDIPRLKVYVNDVEKTEQDPHTVSGGDYTVDYENAKVTFLLALTDTDVVTVDAWDVDGASWVLKPASSKKLKIVFTEVQFSDDILIKDTILFQVRGLVDVIAPHLIPDPYPSGTMLPIPGVNPVTYKTMMDYINEANGAKPLIPKTTGTPTWRDLDHNIMTLPWDYQAVTEVKSWMDIEVKMQHGVEFGGSVATATFYCLSYNDV